MMKTEGLRVPSREELVAVFTSLPFVGADRPTLEAAADVVRRIFRQPGRDDLSLVLQVPTGAWEPEPEANYAGDLVALARQIDNVCGLLGQLPSNGWQALDGAEIAALSTFHDDEIDDDDPSGLRVRALLENLSDNAERIAQTLMFASELARASGTKYLTREFAAAAAEAFNLLTGKAPLAGMTLIRAASMVLSLSSSRR